MGTMIIIQYICSIILYWSINLSYKLESWYDLNIIELFNIIESSYVFFLFYFIYAFSQGITILSISALAITTALPFS